MFVGIALLQNIEDAWTQCCGNEYIRFLERLLKYKI
jgi:hypothetical protein